MTYNIPDYKRAVIEAEKILDELGYDEPPVSPLEIAEYIGLSVVQNVSLQLPTPTYIENKREIAARLDGLNKTIFVNTQQPPKNMIFAIAHQVGYFVLNKQKVVTDINSVRPLLRGKELLNPNIDEMKEAYHFAANLMVPFDMLKKYRKESNSVLSTIFTVPVTVINYQLQEFRK
ncbi:ImmA/IrrE family metallo-endopeptidase [Patescibacteria group bacterium]|nr:ImmA/IrrE family metallo-endopeptidase [Patescibacteria group bacterium]